MYIFYQKQNFFFIIRPFWLIWVDQSRYVFFWNATFWTKSNPDFAKQNIVKKQALFLVKKIHTLQDFLTEC